MKKYIIAALTGALVLASGCKDNPAAPSRDRVVAGLPQSLQALATGIMAQDRTNYGGAYFLWGPIMSRDAISLQQNDSRSVLEFYTTPPDPSDFIGGSQWTGYYQLIRAVQRLLNDPAYTALSAEDQAATRGLVQTLEGQSYIRLIEYRDQNGAVIQGPDSSKLDPIRTKAAVLAYASALLDSGYAALQAASASVPFVLPAGYSLHGDYSQTANLILMNRGLKGKAEVLRALDPVAPNAASAADAIAALNIALAGAPSPVTQEYLDTGPWYEYNPASPESTPNPIPSSSSLVTDNFVASIDPSDLRKANIIPTSRLTVANYSASNRLTSTDPNNAGLQSAPLPMLRNAELFLLRAQAEIATGDLPGATADINAVHTVEGGLPAYATFATAAAAQTAVLYEYRYSFAYIGPQHLDALREYGLLGEPYISEAGMPATTVIISQLPIPQGEVNARGGDITPVS